MKQYKYNDKTNKISITFYLPELSSEDVEAKMVVSPSDNLAPHDLLINLKNKIQACQNVDELYIKTNYQINLDQHAKGLEITSNLYNALDMIIDRELVDIKLFETFRNDYPDFNSYVEITRQPSSAHSHNIVLPVDLIDQFVKVSTAIIRCLPDEEKQLYKPQFDSAFSSTLNVENKHINQSDKKLST